MGQKKESYVVRLRCTDTREDSVVRIQALKETEFRDCLVSRNMTKAGVTLHTIYSVLGIPIVKNGVVTGLRKPARDYLSADSKERDENEESPEYVRGGEEEEKYDEAYEGGDEIKNWETEAKEGKRGIRKANGLETNSGRQNAVKTGMESVEGEIEVDADDDPMEDVQYSENGANADGEKKSGQAGGSASIIFED